MSDYVEGTNRVTVENIILGLAWYFSPENLLLKQKRAMPRGTRKPRRLKVRHYRVSLIDFNKYLDLFLGGGLSEKIGVMEIDDFFLNMMLNSWINQAYVHIFDCDSTTFKKSVNMFEHMEIVNYIYVGVVEHSYKKLLRQMPPVLVTSGKR